MRWLVTGAAGMLASDLALALQDRPVVALGRQDLDITDAAAVLGRLREHQPDVVVNTAAWTAVDLAEEHEADAFAVNATGAANLAHACLAVGAELVHLSTDYVFDGQADAPYDEDAPVRPASAYGRTKAAGEWAVRALLPERSWVLRTAWLYGAAGPSFPRTIMRLAGERDTLEVVDDQVGQPTWTVDVAAALVRLVEAGAPAGTYHATSQGRATWFDLARAVLELMGEDPRRVTPTTTDRFPRPAPRPACSVLGHAAWRRAGLPLLPPWRQSLNQAFPSLRSAA